MGEQGETISILNKEIMSFKNDNKELRQKMKTQEEYVLELNEINTYMIITIRALEEDNSNLVAIIEILRSIICCIEEEDKSNDCHEVNVEKIPKSSSTKVIIVNELTLVKDKFTCIDCYRWFPLMKGWNDAVFPAMAINSRCCQSFRVTYQ
ncbi:hypothetical protein JTB14_002121 [Gonioctena quinquepunctata]|nr:hypothetical protein JTB14_002121 [Gonioctena quinquepunctata]